MAARRVATRLKDWQRLVRLTMRRTLAPVLRAARIGPLLVEPAADRLLLAPQDLRTADPTVAADIYAGVFVFSGRIVECRGRSPFAVEAPGSDWARVLHGFGWLRHLRAADTAVSRSNARILVDDWLRIATHPPVAWEPEVVARRLQAWLAQSPMILADADRGFYHRFLAGLTRHVRWLRAHRGEEPDGLPRLRIAMALTTAAVAIESFRRQIRPCAHRLDEELKRQILPDGGHIGRNPAAVLDLLVDLLPLRQALAARSQPVSATVMGSIDRMMPMLRFFRHCDGAFALFNGASVTPTDLLATVLAYDDGQGRPHGNAPHSGYQRLEAGGTVAVMDCGVAPPPEVSQAAHAGTLAFEFSSGHGRIVVNCGAPFRSSGDWRRLARTTAAHSTLSLADHSSSHIVETGALARLLGEPIVDGPTRVTVEREETPAATTVFADHDGYAEEFGLVHERSLRLSADGDRLDGQDRLLPQGEPRDGVDRAIRFHLHPTVHPTLVGDGVVTLEAPGGGLWEFFSPDVAPTVEESVFLADVHGVRRTRQIVLAVPPDGPLDVRWCFTRLAPLDDLD